MSTRVVSGLAPAGKPHPVTKWSLLIVLLVAVLLGVPKFARAGTPGVLAPRGSQSGGVFVGPFTFDTYIYCTSGFSFSSAYTSSIDGTHSFAFYGAADGSLLVSIDGGGLLLVTSCGDPLTGPNTYAVTYVVSKNTAPPPTPTPTPAPTPVPTPVLTPTPALGHTPTPVPKPTATPMVGQGSSGNSDSGNSGAANAGDLATPSAEQVDTTATPTPIPPSQTTIDPVTGQHHAVTATATPQPSLVTPPQNIAWLAKGWRLFIWPLLGLFALGLLVLAALHPLRRSVVLGHWHNFVGPIWLRIEPFVFKLKRWYRRWPIIGRDQKRRRGLGSQHHSGKLLAHHHTSYSSLIFLLIISTLLVGAISWSSQAAGSVSTLSLTVLGPPPTSGATIDAPPDGTVTPANTITIRGTCPMGLLVEIWRNGEFAGSDFCNGAGDYTVLVTLATGSNDVVAKTTDALGQYGPDSNHVTITYTAPPPTPTPTPSPTPSSAPTPAPTPTTTPMATPAITPQPAGTPAPRPSGSAVATRTPAVGTPPLNLASDRHFYQGIEPGVDITWDLTVSGGTRPYEITWDWGDGHASITTADAAGPITATHVYAQPGAYRTTVRAHDSAGHEVALQLAAIVNGLAPVGTLIHPPFDAGIMIFIWPLLIFMFLIVFSFWLGERHKLALVRAVLDDNSDDTTPSLPPSLPQLSPARGGLGRSS